jgi:hypothetical protein
MIHPGPLRLKEEEKRCNKKGKKVSIPGFHAPLSM